MPRISADKIHDEYIPKTYDELMGPEFLDVYLNGNMDLTCYVDKGLRTVLSDATLTKDQIIQLLGHVGLVDLKVYGAPSLEPSTKKEPVVKASFFDMIDEAVALAYLTVHFGGKINETTPAYLEHMKKIIAFIEVDRKVVNEPLDKALSRPLHMAVVRGLNDLVQLLLMYGADPTLANVRGETPVDLAREFGYSQIVNNLMASSYFNELAAATLAVKT